MYYFVFLIFSNCFRWLPSVKTRRVLDRRKNLERKITLKKPGVDADSLQSDRPVSNLPHLSKVLQHTCIAFSHLYNHLHVHDYSLLDSHQSAYHPNHSVETLLTNWTDDILQQMENGFAWYVFSKETIIFCWTSYVRSESAKQPCSGSSPGIAFSVWALVI